MYRQKKFFDNAKHRLLLALLILLVPAVILFWSHHRSTEDPLQSMVVPKISEQPKDTQVAHGVLPLHFWQTSKGAKVYFVPTEELPIVDVSVIFDAGSARDEKLGGLSYFTASLIHQGNGPLTADELAEQLESLGARYGFSADRERAQFNLRAIADPNVGQATHLFADMIAKPSFTLEDIERLRKQLLIKLKQNGQNPATLADEQFFSLLYNGHPYAHTVEGTQETLQSIQADDLKKFHQKFYVSKNAVITIVGGLHRNKARELSEIIVNALPLGEIASVLPEAPSVANTEEKRLQFPSKQAHVLMGQVGRTAGDPDLFPLTVGNYILGGGDLVARLYKDIREDRGLAYSVFSYFSPMKQRGPFYLSLQTQVNQVDEAVGVLKNTLNHFISQGPTDQELEAAKRYLKGSFPVQLSSNSNIQQVVSDMAFYGLPFDFFDKYMGSIDGVTRQQIVDVFQKRVHPENMALVIVGGETS